MNKLSNKIRYTVPMRWLCPIALFFVVIFSVPQHVHAVQVFLDTENTIHSSADVFYVPVRVDTQGDCINAISVGISYNPKDISVQDVSIGDSIVTLWTAFPVIERDESGEKGHVVFEGGIPGGFCGRVAGDPGQTNILAKLVVSSVSQNLSEGEMKAVQIIVDPSTSVYLHDGKGSVASTTLLGLELTLTQSTSTPENNWITDIKSDTVSPELFEILLVKGPSEGNNKHYIVFNTTDKQSGVDHYEVLETDPDRFGFLTWVPRESYWVPATSPFVLRDQNLLSKIMVKAVDKNGNERIVTYTPEMSPFAELAQPKYLIPVAVGLVAIVLFSLLCVKYFRNRRKRKEFQDNSKPENWVD
jgi:hypothetical protein